jgi:hypothetical protein
MPANIKCCENCDEETAQTIATRILESAVYSAVYSSQSLVNKLSFKQPFDCLDHELKSLLTSLEKKKIENDDESERLSSNGNDNKKNEQASGLDVLDREITRFRDHKRTFLIELQSKEQTERSVQLLMQHLSQNNAMFVFDEANMFLVDPLRRVRIARGLLRKFDVNGVASCREMIDDEDEDLKRKHEAVCSFANLKCERCLEAYSRKYTRKHEKVCKEFEVECPMKCGEILKRREVGLHVVHACQKRKIKCPYEEYGCRNEEESITFSNYKAHMKDYQDKHLLLLTNDVHARLKVIEHEHVRLEKQLADETKTSSNNIRELKRFSEEELKYSKTNFMHLEKRLANAEAQLDREKSSKLALMKRLEVLEKHMLNK